MRGPFYFFIREAVDIFAKRRVSDLPGFENLGIIASITSKTSRILRILH